VAVGLAGDLEHVVIRSPENRTNLSPAWWQTVAQAGRFALGVWRWVGEGFYWMATMSDMSCARILVKIDRQPARIG